jgi:hypothetical protein
LYFHSPIDPLACPQFAQPNDFVPFPRFRLLTGGCSQHFRVALAWRPHARSGVTSWSPFLNRTGEMAWFPTRPIWLCVSAVVELARPALAGDVDVRSSIRGCLGMEQVSMPSANETTQQPTRPRANDGNQAAPLASPSPPPVQYPFSGLTYWLFSFFSEGS